MTRLLYMPQEGIYLSYCPSACPSVCLSVSQLVSPSVRPSVTKSGATLLVQCSSNSVSQRRKTRQQFVLAVTQIPIVMIDLFRGRPDPCFKMQTPWGGVLELHVQINNYFENNPVQQENVCRYNQAVSALESYVLLQPYCT